MNDRDRPPVADETDRATDGEREPCEGTDQRSVATGGTFERLLTETRPAHAGRP